jgi:hypothetical protein
MDNNAYKPINLFHKFHIYTYPLPQFFKVLIQHTAEYQQDEKKLEEK